MTVALPFFLVIEPELLAAGAELLVVPGVVLIGAVALWNVFKSLA